MIELNLIETLYVNSHAVILELLNAIVLARSCLVAVSALGQLNLAYFLVPLLSCKLNSLL